MRPKLSKDAKKRINSKAPKPITVSDDQWTVTIHYDRHKIFSQITVYDQVSGQHLYTTARYGTKATDPMITELKRQLRNMPKGAL